MRSIDLTKLIAQTYLDKCGGMDLSYLWDVALGCYGWMDQLETPLNADYNPERYFFEALEHLLDNKLCKLRSNSQSLPNAQMDKLTPKEQLSLVKEIWIGKDEMDKLDRENDYMGWWFLVHCPYYLAHKMTDEKGEVFWLVI